MLQQENHLSNNMLHVKSKYVAAIILSLILILIVSSGNDAWAEPSLGPADAWSPPVMLSDFPATVGGAYVTGDSNGNVYVVWLANSEPKKQQIVDTVFFRRWDGAMWTPSVDILAVPVGSQSIHVDTLTMDAFGRLLLLWHRGFSLMLSTASPSEAQGASGWRSTALLSADEMWESDIAAEADGTLHVLAAGKGYDVYYMKSRDGGATWTTARVSSGITDDQQVSWAALSIANDGILHATWTMNAPDARGVWSLAGVLYARSIDHGDTWSQPVQITDGVGQGQSSVFARSDGSVLLFWNHRIGSMDGRYVDVSTDAGRTWGPPEVAFDGISGLSGRAHMFEDSRGQLHLIAPGSAARGIGPQGWYSQWQGMRWETPLPVTVQGKLTESEVLDARLVGGNRLLYTWTDFDTKEVWFTDQLLPAPVRPDVYLPLPAAAQPTGGAVSQPAITVTETQAPPPATIYSGLPPYESETFERPLVLAILSSAAIIVAATILIQIRRRQ